MSIIIKIGSNSIIKKGPKLISLAVKEFINQGLKVVIVSSGAVAYGSKHMGIHKPTRTETKQAVASIGQIDLMNVYRSQFSSINKTISQILLTRDCIQDGNRSDKIKRTINELFRMNVIPIINENDTVATEELKFGDNDMLASMTASLLKSKRLILVTDVNGVYTDNPLIDNKAEHIPIITNIKETQSRLKTSGSSIWGTGGIKTKLESAELASSKGIFVNICSYDNIVECAKRYNTGTLIIPNRGTFVPLRPPSVVDINHK